MWKLSAILLVGLGHAVGAVAAISAWDGRRRRKRSASWDRRSRPTAPACRRDRGLSRRDESSSRRSARGVMDPRGKATWARDWWVDKGRSRTPRPLKTVGSFWPYATTLWDYVNRAMPFDRPGVLEPPEVYAAVAYVLNLNGIIEADRVMDATSLPKVKMPNRDGFVADPRPDVGKDGGAGPIACESLGQVALTNGTLISAESIQPARSRLRDRPIRLLPARSRRCRRFVASPRG